MDLTKDDVDILTYIINDTIEYIWKKGVDTELNFYGGLIRQNTMLQEALEGIRVMTDLEDPTT